MTNLEIKILNALSEKNERMAQHDADKKAEYDKYMKLAEIQEIEYNKINYTERARWALEYQNHGYEFINSWKNIISETMYGRIYYEWHSAQAGRRKGTGHGAYATTELTKEEISNIDKVFNAMVAKGYFRISKSGKQAKFINK